MRQGFCSLACRLQCLLARDDGQDLVEYALLVALIAIAAISGSHKVASAVNSVFSTVSTSI
jgi:pilus assembly protein Flp/PilA